MCLRLNKLILVGEPQGIGVPQGIKVPQGLHIVWIRDSLKDPAIFANVIV
jgi:hypothetical protein